MVNTGLRTGAWRRKGMLTTDLVVAMGIIAVALLPLTGLYLHEHMLARACYNRALVMEVVDGEMEALVAGAWKSFPTGKTEYPLPEAIRSNLPPGQLQLTIDTDRLQLVWIPKENGGGGVVQRTAAPR